MEFSPHKNKSNVYCSVYGCKSHAWKHETVRFHLFPKNNVSFVKILNNFNEEEVVDRQDAWVKVLKMGKKISPTMRVCSLHFTPNDYIPSLSQQHYLKKTAVPSVNLPKSSVKYFNKSNEVQSALREKRQRRRSFLKNDIPNDTQQQTLVESSNFNYDENLEGHSDLNEQIEQKNEERRIDRKESTQQNYELNIQIPLKQFNDAMVQVNTDCFIPKFSEFISNDNELSTLTGIPSFKLLKTIKILVDKISQSILRFNTKLDSLEIIIMTFMKLKQNMSYALLAILFKSYTPETCKHRIFQMIDILYICLKPAIFWPSKDNILKNIPLDFVGFENVRAVVDCTEISIQRPKSLCCQIVTYSHYKSCYTVKFMTAVTPAGLISFISKPYGGRASDNAIFEQSEIIKKFDKNDDVMADRGFTVDEICQKNDVKLISPPFLKNRKQFSKIEAISGRKIAKARVHVERPNQRIKTFEIVSSKMSIGLVHKIDEIFTIICAIVNLSQPILRDDKFIQV